ncbi:MAG: pyridoxamine 5'-phosphate oxidase family protein [Pseudomonadota bacterium]
MAQQYPEISDKHRQFIAAQKIFFVGTATADSRVNVSPKGMDALRVVDGNRVLWLNVTGSGNESSAHVQQLPRMTVMFCSFEGAPLILRLYGTARVVHRGDADWAALYGLFNPIAGARQIFDVSIDLVQSSCGMAVPAFDYVDDRELLTEWAAKKGEDGIQQYWADKNQVSMDGAPTHILERQRS